MAVFLHRRAAARGVGDDEVEVFGKRGGQCPRARGVGLHPPGVELERAAAPLRLGDHDLVAGQ